MERPRYAFLAAIAYAPGRNSNARQIAHTVGRPAVASEDGTPGLPAGQRNRGVAQQEAGTA
jgi:hypothetical protein